MREYGTLSVQFWTAGKGRKLRGDAEALALAPYVFACPHGNMLGLFYLPPLYIANDLGCFDAEGALKGLRRLSGAGLVLFDEGSDAVFVLGAAKRNLGSPLKPSDNRVKQVRDLLRVSEKHPFYWDFLHKYAGDLCVEDLLAEAPPKPLRSQEQEKEQEKEQEQGVCAALVPSAVASPKPVANPGVKTASHAVWVAYSAAYLERYTVEPTRNAKVNSQIKAFVGRVPAEDAAAIAATYVRSNNRRYVAAGHSVDCLLKDAEKLRTELLTGRQSTSHAAGVADRKSGRLNEYENVFAQLRAEDEREGLENVTG